MATVPSPVPNPPEEIFIPDQEWSWLRAKTPHEVREGLRQIDRRRGPVLAGQTPEPELWEQIPDRREFLRRLVSDEDCRSWVFTNVAGMGKTVTSEYLQYALSQSEFGCLPVRLTVSEVRDQLDQRGDNGELLEELLFSTIRGKLVAQPADLAREVRRLRDQGRLCLILDALDEVGVDKLDNLEGVLGSEQWKACRVIITGRPYAVRTRQEKLFSTGKRHWEYVRIDPFNADQCERYLASSPDAQDWFREIRQEERQELLDVLQVPRVLKYLRKLSSGEFQHLRTVADVLYGAVRHMLQEALNNTPQARTFSSLDPANAADAEDVNAALRALATIAFLVTSRQHGAGPNVEGIRGRHPLEDFRRQLGLRLRETEFEKPLEVAVATLDRLGQLNFALNCDLLEADTRSLRHIQFQNRSLQDFLCGYFCVNYATPDDVALMWQQNWILEWDRENSEAYRDIWLTVCELPRQDPDVPVDNDYLWDRARPDVWLRMVEQLYRRGWSETGADGAVTWQARRSPEFLYRTWWTLNELCDLQPVTEDHRGWQSAAWQIRENWQSEFEELSREQSERGDLARDLIDDFLLIPTDEFTVDGENGETYQGAVWFGSETGGPEITDEEREEWEWYFSHTEDSDEDLAAYVIRQFNLQHFDRSSRQWALRYWMDIIRRRDLQALEPLRDERSANPAEPVTVPPFCLGRRAVSNAWLRLFVPRHGLRGEFQREYANLSVESDCPAIFVDFFIAWAFAMWSRWDGESSRLPFEDEFEFVGKLGLNRAEQLALPYWWGKEFDARYCNADWAVGRTTAASGAHAIPATVALDERCQQGIMDLLGNVWEWQADTYREEYDRNAADWTNQMYSLRLLRGGAWDDCPAGVRLVLRNKSIPADRGDCTGFRLARTPKIQKVPRDLRFQFGQRLT